MSWSGPPPSWYGPPPVSGWWACTKCWDWNSPYTAPKNCGSCNAPRFDSEEPGSRKQEFSYSKERLAKVRFGELSAQSVEDKSPAEKISENTTNEVQGSINTSTQSSTNSFLPDQKQLRDRNSQLGSSGNQLENSTDEVLPAASSEDTTSRLHLDAGANNEKGNLGAGGRHISDRTIASQVADGHVNHRTGFPCDQNTALSVISDAESIGFSRTSSFISLADSTFSSIASGSSQSSAAGSTAHTEQFSKLVFEDDILQPTCFAIVGLISLERFERKLRRSLRSFSADLLEEATCPREQEAARFVKKRARNCAHLICNELNATRQLFRDKQNLAPRLREQSSESEFSEDEDGMTDIRDLSVFILQSHAFEQLRESLKSYLAQQIFSSLPFSDLDTGNTPYGATSVISDPKPCVNLQQTCSAWLRSKFRWHTSPKLNDGTNKVQWKCVSTQFHSWTTFLLF
ncbi:hypothetical protein ONS95_004533 [Cadophora gregata]|uniref:uncharacterized protein n=1 Tax=Cadophora gregata TaxID=51156 RepID=UPI0026DB4A8C|nr:uncharacterized protein ONS95_004533 [Cadophora gregata]KAK0106027.1 hypothetical protein ONS95_004533 [Cadophora gregata]